MKRTKIICTIGPSCNTDEVLENMIHAGMNVARFNFSHGNHEGHKILMNAVKRVRKELGVPVAIMLDTKGPEFRIGCFENGKVDLQEGDSFTFTANDIIGNNKQVSISYSRLAENFKLGDKILLNNGLIEFKVIQTTVTDIITEVVNGGTLCDRKSMSFPGIVIDRPYLSDQDRKDILFGIENDVDFIACSFVSEKENITAVRDFLIKNNGDGIDLIAKIENSTGVENINSIIDESDGIMIARGDMGVEIPFAKLPSIQKHMITTCRFRGKRIITATEMLESMISNPRPTRAETSDVANAVYDGTSAVMLSGETAMGKYPVEAVKTMSNIVLQTEQDIDYENRFWNSEFKIKNEIDAISHATCALSIDLNAKLIVVCSRSGKTARMVSRFRSSKPILGLTTDEKVWRKLALSWSVIPVMSKEFQSTDVLFYHASIVSKKSGIAKSGDVIVITGGETNGCSGNTNLIKYSILK